MRTTLRLMISALLGQHPSDGILQAYSDCELSDLATSAVRRHVLKCAHCRNEIRESRELFESMSVSESSPRELMFLRERIFGAIAARSAPDPQLVGDMRRLLGTRAAERFSKGVAAPDIRVELAAFLGKRAAKSFLTGLPD